VSVGHLGDTLQQPASITVTGSALGTINLGAG
jgi:hypothetical protein